MNELRDIETVLQETIKRAAERGDAPQATLLEVVSLLKDAHPSWHWVGIYYMKDASTLELGPYVGHPTEHTTIKAGDGVCGTAVMQLQNQLIDDVQALDNYIACSAGTRSEIVVLIYDGDELVGQFDLDSDDLSAFSEEDEELLERLAKLVAPLVAKLKSTSRPS